MKEIEKIAAILAVIVMTMCSITVLDSVDAADETESVELTPVDLNQAYLDSIGISLGRYNLDGNNAYTLKESLDLGSYYLYIIGTCSLDLNGYSITSSAENTINVRNTMTITDSSGGNGAVISTFTGTSSYTGAVTNFGTLTIEGGSFEGNTAIKMNHASNGTLNINGGTFEGNECIVINSGNATLTNGTFTGGDVAVLCRNNSTYSLDVHIEGGNYTADAGVVIMGKSSQTTSLTVSGGTITGTNYGISGNGSNDNTSIIVEGGTISATNAAGIYHPQVGDLKVTDGTITGSTGIQFCGAGSIDISGGTITGNGNFTGPTREDTSDTSGFIYDGYALSIVTREGYHDADDTVEVSISGGNFTSKHGSAISTYRFQITDDQVKINEGSNLKSIVKAIEISDGDFNSAAEYAIAADPADVQADRYDVTGGKYTGGSVQDDLLGDGYGMVDGEVVVTDAVAHIGETPYATIHDAIDAVQDGETIALVESDESLVISSNINPKANIGFTIDLNGRTLDFGDTYRIVGSSGNGKLTISNGTLDFGHPSPIQVMGYTLELVNCKIIGTGYTTADDETTSGTSFIWMFGSADSSAEEYSNLIVDSDTEFVFDNNSVDVGAYVVNVNFLNYAGDQNDVYAAYGVTVDFAGKMTGNIGCAFYVNGNVKPTDGNVPKIHIDMSDEIKTGGGIYAAGYAEWDIDGCNFETYSAISIKSGTFDISGGVFHATGEFKDPADANGNGSEDTGAAISITSNSSYPQKTVVNISGGTFTSDNGYAVYEGIAKKADGTYADDASYATISISGGDFKGNSEKGDVKIDWAENKKVIIGGTFSSDVSNFVDEEYDYDADTGNIVLDTSTGAKVIAVIGDTQYPSLEAALDKASSGDTIVLQNDTTESITISSDLSITLNLNGHTITNTEDQNTITVEGELIIIDDTGIGTIDNTSNGKSAIYNNGTVTIKSGNITKSVNKAGNTYYVVFNHGTMSIEGGHIYSDGTAASSLIVNGYSHPATMTISGGHIKFWFNAVKNEEYGKLTVTGGTIDSDHQSIQNWNVATITGGTFNGEVATWHYNANHGSHTMTIEGGTFNGDVYTAKYVDDLETGDIGAIIADPQITIKGGVFNGGLFTIKGDLTNSEILTPTEDENYDWMDVSGGTFTRPVEDRFLASGFALTGNNGMYGVGQGHKITFNVSIDGYDVEVTSADGTVGYEPEAGSYLLADGSYRAVITADGYATTEVGFEVSGKDDTIAVDMEAVYGITITAIPSEAEITIDGKSVENGTEVQLTGGIHDVTVSLDGYVTETFKITVGENGQTAYTVTLDPVDDGPVYPPFIPGGDDDDVVIPPTVVVDQGSSDDDEAVKIAACAAAAVAAAILAVLAIALYRKD